MPIKLLNNMNIKVKNNNGKYLRPFTPICSSMRLYTNSYNISAMDCQLDGTIVATEVDRDRNKPMMLITNTTYKEELVKEISNVPIAIGNIDTI